MALVSQKALSVFRLVFIALGPNHRPDVGGRHLRRGQGEENMTSPINLPPDVEESLKTQPPKRLAVTCKSVEFHCRLSSLHS